MDQQAHIRNMNIRKSEICLVIIFLTPWQQSHTYMRPLSGWVLALSNLIYAALLKQLTVLRALSMRAPSMVAGGYREASDVFYHLGAFWSCDHCNSAVAMFISSIGWNSQVTAELSIRIPLPVSYLETVDDPLQVPMKYTLTRYRQVYSLYWSSLSNPLFLRTFSLEKKQVLCGSSSSSFNPIPPLRDCDQFRLFEEILWYLERNCSPIAWLCRSNLLSKHQ